MLFFSYAREDREIVTWLIGRLEYRLGLDVWSDLRLKIGTSYTHDIQESLIASNAVVVLWTKSSVKSVFVIDEATRARETGKLIPVKLDGSTPPPGFGVLQSIDMTDLVVTKNPLENAGAGFEALASAIIEQLRDVKWPQRIKLNSTQSAERDIISRLIASNKIAVVTGNFECVPLLPFYSGLQMLGFQVDLISEPMEASGKEMVPLLKQIDAADTTVFPLLPIGNYDWFQRVCSDHSKRRVFVLFGFLTSEFARHKFSYLANIPDSDIIKKKWIGFPLEGPDTEETWDVVKVILGYKTRS